MNTATSTIKSSYGKTQEAYRTRCNQSQLGWYPRPSWLGGGAVLEYPLGRTCDRNGVSPCEGTWDQRLRYPSPRRDMGRKDIPPQKGHGTRGWEGTWNKRLGYPSSVLTDACEKITSRRTSYAGGNYSVTKEQGQMHFHNQSCGVISNNVPSCHDLYLASTYA